MRQLGKARALIAVVAVAMVVGACGSSATPSASAQSTGPFAIGYSNGGGVGNGFREEQVCTAKAEVAALTTTKISGITVIHRNTDAAGQLSDLRDLREGEMRVVGGVVTALARKYTKRGDLMATFVLEDLAAAVEVMVFPKTMAQFGHVLEEDAIVCVKGRLDTRDDTPKIIAMEITRPEIVLDGGPPVRLRVKVGSLSDQKAEKLESLLREHPGDSPVFLHLESPEKTTVLRLGDDHLVDARNGLFAELRVLLGADCVA